MAKVKNLILTLNSAVLAVKDFRCKKEYGLSHSIFCILHGWSKLNKKNVKFNHIDKFDMYKFRHLLCPEYDILIIVFF